MLAVLEERKQGEDFEEFAQRISRNFTSRTNFTLKIIDFGESKFKESTSSNTFCAGNL